MSMTFGLLGLAICAVWLQPNRIAGQAGIPLWLLPFSAAIGAGLAAGYLSGIALLWLALFGSAAYATACSESRLRLALFGAVTMLLALALALHLLPGFNRLPLVQDFQFSADAIPYTQYASFDKAAVGLILLALLSRRSGTVAEWGTMLRSTLPIAVITIVTTIAATTVAGYVRPDFKWSWYTPIFLGTNLLFVCVAEEAFFRGFLQERLTRALTHVRFGETAAIVCSAVLFGAAHLGGGRSTQALQRWQAWATHIPIPSPDGSRRLSLYISDSMPCTSSGLPIHGFNNGSKRYALNFANCDGCHEKFQLLRIQWSRNLISKVFRSAGVSFAGLFLLVSCSVAQADVSSTCDHRVTHPERRHTDASITFRSASRAPLPNPR